MRRMDRYNKNVTNSSRINKNQKLYQDFSNNTVYTNITDIVNENAFEISNDNETSHTTREKYQQMKKYQDIKPLPRNRKELEDVNYLMQKQENKVYDINSVLEEARKNRQPEEIDERRKLKNNAYNILSDSNVKELEKYREEKKKRLTSTEEEEIKELIDTISSKTLAKDIEKATSTDLFSDLMATNVLDKVEPQIEDEKTDEIETEEDEKEKTTTQELTPQEQIEKKDTEFYTRSMDLSDKDFNFSDEFVEKQIPTILKILIFLLVIALVAAAAYFIHQKII